MLRVESKTCHRVAGKSMFKSVCHVQADELFNTNVVQTALVFCSHSFGLPVRRHVMSIVAFCDMKVTVVFCDTLK